MANFLALLRSDRGLNTSLAELRATWGGGRMPRARAQLLLLLQSSLLTTTERVAALYLFSQTAAPDSLQASVNALIELVRSRLALRCSAADAAVRLELPEHSSAPLSSRC